MPPSDRSGGSSVLRLVLRVPLAWRRAAGATLALWAVVLLLTAVAASTLPPARFTLDVGPVGYPLWPAPSTDATGWPLLRDALVRFDALYYLGIADTWYPPGDATPGAVADAYAFFPGYPALVAAVGLVTGGRLVAAAAIVSTVATVAALAGVHRLVEELLTRTEGDAPGARRPALPAPDVDAAAGRAVAVLAAFPTSYHLLAPYAESVHVAAVVWAFVLAARGRTGQVVGLAAVAAVSRPVGLLLAPAMWVLGSDRARQDQSPARRLLLTGAPLLGLGLVALNGLVLTGEPVAFGLAQSRWERTWRPPWIVLRDGYLFATQPAGADASGYFLLDAVAFSVVVLAVAVLAWWSWRRRPVTGLAAALVVHALVSIGLWLVQVFPGRPFMSVPRFALAVPAVVVGLVLATSHRAVERTWLLVSGALLAVHFVLFSRVHPMF